MCDILCSTVIIAQCGGFVNRMDRKSEGMVDKSGGVCYNEGSSIPCGEIGDGMADTNENNMQGGGELLLPGRGFFADGATGPASDACPLVTGQLLIAAAGRENTPLYTVAMGGIDGLYDALYGDLLPRSEAHTALLADTFGTAATECTRPAGAFAAALAEACALDVLTRNQSAEISAARMSEELDRRLGMLQDRLSDKADKLTETEDALCEVVLAACRVEDGGDGAYLIDVFSAGRYTLLLLDEQGGRPLWVGTEAGWIPGTGGALRHHTLELEHPAPFALLLLSEGAMSAGENITRTRETADRALRHRVHLEEAIWHLLTACLKEQEFGDRATQYFAGHIQAGHGAAGALLPITGTSGFEGFCEVGRARLHRVEELITLLPEGYHPATAPAIPSRRAAEEAYLEACLRADPTLSDRVGDAVYLSLLERIRHPEVQRTEPEPTADRLLGTQACMDDLDVLCDEELMAAYAICNAENAEDLARIQENRRTMQEALCAQWVTWRPILAAALRRFEADAGTADASNGALTAEALAEHERTAALQAMRSRDYAHLCMLNARLGEALTERRRAMKDIETLLEATSERIRLEGNDWLSGRACETHVSSFVDAVAEELPVRLMRFKSLYRTTTDRYHSLLTAYTSEREALFRRDTQAPEGFFSAAWHMIPDGTLPEGMWEAIRRVLSSVKEADAYRERLESIRRISIGTGALLARVQRRGADRRTAQMLSGRIDLRVAALRASIYRPARADEPALLSDEQIHALRETLMLREEQERLSTRMQAMFEAYEAMYTEWVRG